MATTLQEACRKIAQEHPRADDRPPLTERDMYLQRIREYNHPDPRPPRRIPCRFCGGRDNYISSKGESVHLGSMMMVIAPGGQSQKYYHGLLVPCPACNHETTTFNVNAWWDEALPEVQKMYRQAAHATYKNAQEDENNGEP